MYRRISGVLTLLAAWLMLTGVALPWLSKQSSWVAEGLGVILILALTAVTLEVFKFFVTKQEKTK